MQIRLPSGPSANEVKKAGKIIALVVLSVMIAIGGIGATIFIRVFRGVSDATERHREAFKQAAETRRQVREKMEKAKRILNERVARAQEHAGGAMARAGKNKGGAFRIESDRPLAADIDNDGIADLLVRGSGRLVAALDGTSGAVLWKTTLPGSTRKIFLAGKTLLVAHGYNLTALALKDGRQRWTTKLDDRSDHVELRDSGIAVQAGDERLTLNPATGKKRAGKTARFGVLTVDDGRKWLSNLGRAFRLSGKDRRKRRVRMYYCQHGRVIRGKHVVRRMGPITTGSTTYGCDAKHALVYAMDKRGRRQYLIGLQKGRGKIWERALGDTGGRFRGSTPVVGIRNDLAAVAHGDRLTATVELLSLATGKAKWKHSITGPRPNVRGVVLTAKRVFVRTGSWVMILDAATGKPPATGIAPGDALPAP